jgi:predicted lipoprotein with Yx(FWY)xxD motif
MTARFPFAFSLGLLAVAALAGCGGSSSSTSATTNAGGGSTASGGQGAAARSVDVASDPKLGPILVDAQGRTLYLFQNDTGGQSSCSGSCAKIWPPDVTTASPKAGNGVSASKLGTVKRSDGTMQITYAGHPLYTYTADTSPGQVTGNGINSFGGVWNAVQPNGSNAPAGTSSGGGGSASAGGGGASTSPGGGGSSGGGYGY